MPEFGEKMGNQISAVRARYDTLRSLGFAGLSPVFAGIGAKFTNPVRILKVTNLTNANLIVSFNGVDDMDIVSAFGFFLYDYTTNKSDAGGVLEHPAEDRIYVRTAGAAATLGTVYVTVVYASDV